MQVDKGKPELKERFALEKRIFPKLLECIEEYIERLKNNDKVDLPFDMKLKNTLFYPIMFKGKFILSSTTFIDTHVKAITPEVCGKELVKFKEEIWTKLKPYKENEKVKNIRVTTLNFLAVNQLYNYGVELISSQVTNKNAKKRWDLLIEEFCELKIREDVKLIITTLMNLINSIKDPVFTEILQTFTAFKQEMLFELTPKLKEVSWLKRN